MMLARTMMSFAMVARPVVAVIGVTVIAVRPLVLVCRIRRIGIGVRLRMAVIGLRLPISMAAVRSEEHTSELQSLMRISYAVVCLKNKKKQPHDLHQQYNPITQPHTSKCKYNNN